mgnify:CR=1 FL=1
MNRLANILLVAIALQMAACASVPTSPRADEVRSRVMPWIESQMALGSFSTNADLHLVAFKEERVLEAWMKEPLTGHYKLFKSWPICKISGGIGPKTREGDNQAPEGFYRITAQQLNPNSQFHLAFNIGYPNDYDRALGRTGSMLMVHGDCVSKGCYAMTDDGIEEIYMLVEYAMRHGQSTIPVDLYPFRMTDQNMARHAKSPHLAFWQAMQGGYKTYEEDTAPSAPFIFAAFGS